MKNSMEFKLEGQEYIELNALLKILGLVESGGHAKVVIDNGEVKVDGQTETRKRKKLRNGEKVEYSGNIIHIKL
ncbi:MAG: RNA-binding S4 domain-containing protein [Bacteroidetes bacterium]|nr:RNA-binding S4 domain-containing protein [Bacteroidota bacterium]